MGISQLAPRRDRIRVVLWGNGDNRLRILCRFRRLRGNSFATGSVRSESISSFVVASLYNIVGKLNDFSGVGCLSLVSVESSPAWRVRFFPQISLKILNLSSPERLRNSAKASRGLSGNFGLSWTNSDFRGRISVDSVASHASGSRSKVSGIHASSCGGELLSLSPQTTSFGQRVTSWINQFVQI